MAAEYAAHPEWREATQARQAETEGASAFRFFHADVLRKECPECGWATAVEFDSPHGPSRPGRQPTKCLQCSAADIHNAAVQEAKTPVKSGALPAQPAGSAPAPPRPCPRLALEAADARTEPEAGP